MKLTRRELAAVVSGTALAAQTAQQAPAAANELQAARNRLKANSDLLAQQPVPMATEPAFRFTA